MSKKRGAFLEVGIWLLFVLLLVPVGFVGWIVGRDSAPAATRTVTVTAGSAAAAPDWSLPNGDLANTRVTHGSSITAANVSQLGVAWTTSLTASSIYGTFAADPAIANGVVYLQDLDSNVWASDLRTGRVLWRRDYNQKSIGPNGVTYADGVVYGAATGFAFALDAKTGR
ncbi:MAG: PQQ-binding-like beta-propeller repeat protein, partial [Actinobacteria bacterium]|nr:PQQ-binding-like beta-propeller repeat protein [Actinomycetota bacterium]